MQFSPQRTIIGIAVALSFALLVGLAWSQNPPPRQSSQVETTYEYWLVEMDVSDSSVPSQTIQTRLNQLGASGWDLVDVREQRNGKVWLFMKKEER